MKILIAGARSLLFSTAAVALERGCHYHDHSSISSVITAVFIFPDALTEHLSMRTGPLKHVTQSTMLRNN